MTTHSFIVVDKAAVEAIAQSQPLQSTEYEQGALLADALQTGYCEAKISADLYCGAHGGGLFFVGEPTTGPLLVFDLEAAPLFATHADAERLLIFQRLIRTAVKTWNNLKLSSNEKAIPGSSKIVMFPFPITTQSGYRITVERNPDPKRGKKRFGGQHLLVFREGLDEGLGAQEVPDVKNFRRALDAYPDASAAYSISLRSHETPLPAAAVGSTTVIESIRGATFGNALNFQGWLPHLTRRQMEFVRRVPEGPERLEGPAGTGKTLSLVLKCVNALAEASKEGRKHHAAFFAHSEATRAAIAELFAVIEPEPYSHRSSSEAQTSVLVTTLQGWCADTLGERFVTDAQFLDRDALDAKQIRLWYIEESLEDAMSQDFDTFRRFMSDDFACFLEKEDRDVVVDMLEHEISVMVKGRAEEDLERYKSLPAIQYGLPMASDDDRGFVYLVYRKYNDRLVKAAQYDTDDIVLTALKQLQTPIWRRRRTQEGFQSLFIDETHLFNLNELSVFHYLTESPDRVTVSFSIDRSQAPGDRGLTSAMLASAVVPNSDPAESQATAVRTIFRSSPDIAALAGCITASGVTLFTNFEDPLKAATSAFTQEDESRASPPCLVRVPNDEALIQQAFVEAEALRNELKCSRGEVLVATLSISLFSLMRQYVQKKNKPVEVLTRRGDSSVKHAAKTGGRFVLATADCVGGLEFEAVVLAGIDDGRVPPTRDISSTESKLFQSFRAHNHLYVAVTRARYRLVVLASEERGPSPLLSSALQSNVLIEHN